MKEEKYVFKDLYEALDEYSHLVHELELLSYVLAVEINTRKFYIDTIENLPVDKFVILMDTEGYWD